MTKYQVSFTRRDKLSIEVEAYTEDDAINKAEYWLYDHRLWDVQELDTEFDRLVEVEEDEDSDPAADRGDWEFHQAHDQ